MEINEELFATVCEAILAHAEEEGFEISEDEVEALALAVVNEESQDDKLDRIYQKLRRDPREKKRRDQEHQQRKEKKMYSEEDIEAHLIDVLGEEEYMQLDELSKKTLGSYIGKATQSYANHSVDKARHQHDGDVINRMDHNAPRGVKSAVSIARDAQYDAVRDADAKRMKRGRGVMRAVDKLTKESVEEMLNFAHEGKPVEFAQSFQDAISARVLDKLDAFRPEVAADLFGSRNEE